MGVKIKKIPWTLVIPPEVMTEYTGVKLRDYYLNPEVKMYVQLESEKIFNNLYGLPVNKCVSASGGLCYAAASILGAEIEFPEDHPPEIRERKIKSIEDIKDIKVCDPCKSGVIPMILQHYDYMKGKTEGTDIKVESGMGGIQGPFTTAVILRGTDMFMDIILHPVESKMLLQKCTETSIVLTGMLGELFGCNAESMWLGDDYGGLISPEMYSEFSYPYIKRIFDTYNPIKRTLHCETLKKGHLKYLKMLEVDWYDPGVNNDLTVEDIISETDVKFTYNLFTVRDMLNGNPETIRKKYFEIIESGAPAVTAEICRGTPSENVLAYVNTAREFE